MPEKYRMISELKSNDCLKVDGRKVDVLLIGLRNDYQFHQSLKLLIINGLSDFVLKFFIPRGL